MIQLAALANLPWGRILKIAAPVAAGLFVWGLWESRESAKEEAARARDDLARVQSANDHAVTEIAGLVRLREIDGATVRRLQGERQRLAGEAGDVRQRLEELRRANDEVHTWMAVPIPPPLGCVLHGEDCGATGDEPPAAPEPAVGAVQSARALADDHDERGTPGRLRRVAVGGEGMRSAARSAR